MFHIFHFLQCEMVLGIVNPLSNEKRCLISMPFLSTYIDVRTLNFSRLPNPDWSIQVSRAPVVCKAVPRSAFGKLFASQNR